MTFDQISIDQMGKVRNHRDPELNGLIVIVIAVDRMEIKVRVMQARGPWQRGDEISLVPDNFDPNIL